MRVGLVGAGAVARRHADTLLGFGDVEVVGVADPDAGRAAELAAHCGAPAYRDHDELLATARPDALEICVPPFAHGPAELAAVDAGVPFLVEKPLAADLATAQEIARRVAATDLVTAVGYHWRYLDTLDEARALLADRPPRLLQVHWLGPVPPPAWWRTRALSGGQTVEQTTHVLDVARVLAGEVVEVAGEATRRPWATEADGDVADVTVATLRFASGAVGALTSTALLGGPHRAGVVAFAEGLAVELTEFELAVDRGDGPVRRAAQGSAKARSDRAFLDAVAGRGEVRVDYAEALRTHRLACAIAAATDDREPVRLTAGA